MKVLVAPFKNLPDEVSGYRTRKFLTALKAVSDGSNGRPHTDESAAQQRPVTARRPGEKFRGAFGLRASQGQTKEEYICSRDDAALAPQVNG
jgi:hypothetical protein